MTDLAGPSRRHPHRTPNRAAWHVLPGGRLRPVGNRLLVQPDPPQHRLPSGLWLPETAEDEHRAQTGMVLGVGPGRGDVAAGQRVLYRRWSGTEVTLGAHTLLLLAPRDVFAVLG